MLVPSILLFVLAAIAEIGGAWLVWQGVREHRGWTWIGAGVIALGLYGFVATLQPDAHFGRILAALRRCLRRRVTGMGHGPRRLPPRPLGRHRSPHLPGRSSHDHVCPTCTVDFDQNVGAVIKFSDTIERVRITRDDVATRVNALAGTIGRRTTLNTISNENARLRSSTADRAFRFRDRTHDNRDHEPCIGPAEPELADGECQNASLIGGPQSFSRQQTSGVAHHPFDNRLIDTGGSQTLGEPANGAAV